VTVTFSIVDYPHVSERSFAVRVETEGMGLRSTGLQTFALAGPTVVVVGTGGNTDANLASDLLTKQVGRYVDAAT
jgi:hypothetical protein